MYWVVRCTSKSSCWPSATASLTGLSVKGTVERCSTLRFSTNRLRPPLLWTPGAPGCSPSLPASRPRGGSRLEARRSSPAARSSPAGARGPGPRCRSRPAQARRTHRAGPRFECGGVRRVPGGARDRGRGSRSRWRPDVGRLSHRRRCAGRPRGRSAAARSRARWQATADPVDRRRRSVWPHPKTAPPSPTSSPRRSAVLPRSITTNPPRAAAGTA